MTGRFEHKMEHEEKMQRSIEGKPDYIRGYYYSMSRMECMTKVTYLRNTLNFINYMESHGIDISDPKNFTLDVVNMYFNDAQYITKNGVKCQASISSINTKITALTGFFEYLTGSKRIEENVMKNIRRIRGKDNVKRVYMTTDDVQNSITKIQNVIDTKKVNWVAIRDLAIVSIFLQTGVRVTALTEINMEDVHIATDGDGNLVYILLDITDKENEYYHKKLLGDVAQNLMNWINTREKVLAGKQMEALFVTRYLDRISTWATEQVVKRYTPKVNGKQITCHKLRGTYARTLYEATGDIYFVQNQMGHKSASTTAIYVGKDSRGDDRAGEIMNNMFFGRRAE